MNFSQVSLRLRAIKHDIQELRLTPKYDVREKIEVLKKINFLLKEQNQLLRIRRKLLEEGCSKPNKLYTSYMRQSKVA